MLYLNPMIKFSTTTHKYYKINKITVKKWIQSKNTFENSVNDVIEVDMT